MKRQGIFADRLYSTIVKICSKSRTAETEEWFWGNGYSLAGLIDHTFGNTDFLKLEAYHRIENIKSGRVLEKSAMHITNTVERFARDNILPHGEVCYYINKK